MHDCQKFREDWITSEAEDYGDCEECRNFCEEAQLVLQATDGSAQPMPELPQEYWNRFEARLHDRLVRENSWRFGRVSWKSGAVAAAAALVLAVSWGNFRITQPLIDRVKGTPQIEFDASHIEGLNPTVVEFLAQSELFLRDFTKIEPAYVADVEYAKKHAIESLSEITQQKDRAADFEPVQIALDDYESVLRDIKNLQSAEDLRDIQDRVVRNGLITSMKAYQPQVVLVSKR
jgi:hypothetical protein